MASPLRLVATHTLGDKLQYLSHIAPLEVAAIELIVDDRIKEHQIRWEAIIKAASQTEDTQKLG